MMRTLILSLGLLLPLSVFAGAPADAVLVPNSDQEQAKAELQQRGLKVSMADYFLQLPVANAETIRLYVRAGMPADAVDAHGVPALVAVLSDADDFKRGETTPFRGALIQERMKVIEYLLAQGADPNRADEQGTTPLHMAASYSWFWWAIPKLVAAGARIDPHEQSFSMTPLDVAITEKNGEGVKALLQAGANVNEPADRNTSPLVLAIEADSMTIVDILLGAGADPKTIATGGRSCLHQAADSASPDIIKTLLAAHLDPKLKDDAGRTPYDLAKARGRNQMVLNLLDPALAK
jgi:ankyrin repeat protein